MLFSKKPLYYRAMNNKKTDKKILSILIMIKDFNFLNI